ncbi:heterokaryon incompatibility protein-domain-containing protein [Clohesyomyces aquaticus]|uniref:Heterokaryon incompatibility protein-domain-containing protein n=1 Tax=Clohesyomyces aquaticus TaxID=1231657 RepID=A0A1Y1ZQE0_9PLEO|nr:heterokaryon incompatibility protein-domain-containing protein [Clohesyomyces aquaticus]
MAELCTACTQFIDIISEIPQASHNGTANFTTGSQIEAAAFTCMLCKIFSDSFRYMATKIDLNVILQIHWLVSKPGPTFVMLDFPAPDNISHDSFVELISAASTPSNVPLRKRYLISYRKILGSGPDTDPNVDIAQYYPIWQPRILNVNTRFKFVDSCFSNCMKRHVACRKRVDGLPSRLLDLQGSGKGRISLVNTTSLQTALPKYFTLSHCWGKHQLLTTTQQTIVKHQEEGIRVSDLPKTYADAVKVTQRLGVQYLWIDSLCIIQDSIADWEREAVAMASIYLNSALTISATSSSDGQGGCYLEAHDKTLESISKTTESGRRYSIKLRDRITEDNIVKPLLKRGWVLQETVLSRRILHLTSNQIFWQCKECFYSEDGSIAQNGTGGRMGLSPQGLGFLSQIRIGEGASQDRSVWHAWVEDYSGRDFTYEKDRLPALAGLIRYHQLDTNDVPLLGLWISTLHLDLAWSASDPEQSSKSTEFPSWTWLSLRGVIDYSSTDDIEDPSEIETPLRVIEHHVEWSGAPHVSSLTRSRLILSSKCFQLTPNEDGETLTVVEYENSFTEYVSSDFDVLPNNSPQAQITCFVLFHLSDAIIYLMIKPVSKPGVYERIGLGTLGTNGEGSPKRFVAELEMKTIELM